ncbi:MAG: hypothetical protein RLZ98_832 [Pseudomonadota bacterium]
MTEETSEEAVARMRQAFLSKTFYLAFLEPTEKAGDRGAVRALHFEYVKALEASGKLMMAGPFIDEATGQPNGYGMFILRVENRAAAEKILDDEPFTKEGYRTYRLAAWRVNEGSINISLTLSDQKALFC